MFFLHIALKIKIKCNTMKTIYKSVFLFLFCFIPLTINAQATLDNDGISIGKKRYTPFKIGYGWGLEYWEGGFNLWRPWPYSYSGNYLLFFDRSNKVGIGKKPTTYALEVAGDVMIEGPLYGSSDLNIKKNITSLNSKKWLDTLFDLNAKSYTKKHIPFVSDIHKEVDKLILSGKILEGDAANVRKQLSDEMLKTDDRIEFGFLAQELKEILPNLVYEDNEGYLSIDYLGLIPILLQSIKELQVEINSQKEMINKALTNLKK